MLANRVKKRFKHLNKHFARQNIEVFRLYDWEIPEIRAVVDWYAGHLVIGEYIRRQSTPEWLPMMGAAVAKALRVTADIDHTNRKIVITEHDLKFYVNPWDYVDTGLFSDHRSTRRMVGAMAAGKDFLNLYCYTGSFTCYAAKGGARSTVSVDRSQTAVDWARENLVLNDIPAEGNALLQMPAFLFLHKAKLDKQSFDLAVVDPPSYSTDRSGKPDFDIARDHPDLLKRVVAIMRKGATIFFSTNHQGFEPRMAGLKVSGIEEITDQTIPEDYVNKRRRIHRCWRILV
jgi:23S rRNA (cytosine1962-C5)-methyltransferase